MLRNDGDAPVASIGLERTAMTQYNLIVTHKTYQNETQNNP